MTTNIVDMLVEVEPEHRKDEEGLAASEAVEIIEPEAADEAVEPLKLAPQFARHLALEIVYGKSPPTSV
eukprot:1861841-Amphidinium_carterae.2